MQPRGTRRSRVARAGLATVAIVLVLAIRSQPLQTATRVAATPAVRALALSDQARRYLALQYRSYPTEFMGCMIGTVWRGTVVVSRIAPADVDPAHSTPTRVVPSQSCEAAGWSGTVGVIHSHPDGQNCWYYFPTTVVLSSDAASFARQSYLVDAIMCGDHIVWIGRDMAERQLPLLDTRSSDAAVPSGR